MPYLELKTNARVQNAVSPDNQREKKKKKKRKREKGSLEMCPVIW